MNPLAPPSRPGLTPWLRALRDTWWVVLMLFAAVPALVVVEANIDAEDRFRATATLAAVELDVPVPGLSRTVTAAFDTADVAESIREQIPYSGDPRRPPEAIEIEPVLDTVVVRVRATDSDPEVAAALANAGAAALVEEMGEFRALGEFAITDRARPPERTLEPEGSPVLAVVGLVAAAGLSLVVLVVRMSVRRPVLGASDVRETIDTAWVADLVIPRRHRLGATLPGLGRLRVPSVPTVLVAGIGCTDAERLALTTALGSTAVESGSATVVLVGDDREVPEGLPPEVEIDRQAADVGVLPTHEGSVIIDFDTSEAVVDAFHPGPDEAFAIAVVGARATVRDLQQFADQTDPDIGIGVVLVRSSRR